MNSQILSVILLISFSLIDSKLIPTNDLKSALSEAEPGDIIELKSGIYRDAPYSLKSGLPGYPIKIKSASYADVVFSGTQNSCIFEANSASYITIEGEMVFKNALCGIKAMNSNNINITGVIITDTKEQGIMISGKNHYIYNNTVVACSLSNKQNHEQERFEWYSCIEASSRNYYDYDYSKNITIEKNIIGYSYGEGIRIFIVTIVISLKIILQIL